MLTPKAKYDGKNLLFDETIEVKQSEDVIVTFLNRNPMSANDISGKDIATLVANSNAFNFLNDE
ncbi:MAG: hypothetical protein H7101_06180 [Deinococcales bacterium]|nr:hypothetical protein [Chitinophagaceae bacterium]